MQNINPEYFRAFTNAYASFSIVLYFSYESLKILIKNEIDCFNPSEFFCSRPIVIVSSDANEKTEKYLAK